MREADLTSKSYMFNENLIAKFIETAKYWQGVDDISNIDKDLLKKQICSMIQALQCAEFEIVSKYLPPFAYSEDKQWNFDMTHLNYYWDIIDMDVVIMSSFFSDINKRKEIFKQLQKMSYYFFNEIVGSVTNDEDVLIYALKQKKIDYKSLFSGSLTVHDLRIPEFIDFSNWFIKIDETKKKAFEIEPETKELFENIKNNQNVFQVLMQCKDDAIAFYLYLLYQTNTIRGIECNKISRQIGWTKDIASDIKKACLRSSEIYEYVKSATGCDVLKLQNNEAERKEREYSKYVFSCYINLKNWGAFEGLNYLKANIETLQNLHAISLNSDYVISDEFINVNKLTFCQESYNGLHTSCLLASVWNDNNPTLIDDRLVYKILNKSQFFLKELKNTIEDMSISLFGKVIKSEQQRFINVDRDIKIPEEIKQMQQTDNNIYVNMTIQEFGAYCKEKSGYDFTGVYVLKDITTGQYYVGKGDDCLNRCKAHFQKGGDERKTPGTVADLYFNHGHEFIIEYLIPIDYYGRQTGVYNVNKQEKYYIDIFDAYEIGINKTKGNSGRVNSHIIENNYNFDIVQHFVHTHDLQTNFHFFVNEGKIYVKHDIGDIHLCTINPDNILDVTSNINWQNMDALFPHVFENIQQQLQIMEQTKNVTNEFDTNDTFNDIDNPGDIGE